MFFIRVSLHSKYPMIVLVLYTRIHLILLPGGIRYLTFPIGPAFKDPTAWLSELSGLHCPVKWIPSCWWFPLIGWAFKTLRTLLLRPMLGLSGDSLSFHTHQACWKLLSGQWVVLRCLPKGPRPRSRSRCQSDAISKPILCLWQTPAICLPQPSSDHCRNWLHMGHFFENCELIDRNIFQNLKQEWLLAFKKRSPRKFACCVWS